MPREIKTTIAVDGEAAFKRAINDANTSLRNMGTQLTLAQAQFKKDGDAMKLMETRSKALKGEIGQQEEIVRALEKAVADSTKAYGENSQKTEKWEAELNRAKAKLVSLQSELTLNDAGLDRNGKAFDESAQKAADYQATLQNIGKNVSFQSISEGIGGITGTIEGAIKKVFSFAKAIRDTFADAGEWADELMTNATKYDMDVETLQKWQNAADFIDTDVETIISARDKLGKKMKSGWKDGELDMWQVLGIDLTDAEGKYRDKMDVMWEVGESLMNMAKIDGDDVRADAYAMEVFGKGWRELMPLFAAGREEWEKTVAEQQVVSEERVKALGELDDANQALENSWDVTKYSFLAELAPVITDVTNAVTEMLKAFNEWMDTDEGKQAMQELSNAIRELFSGLTNIKFKDVIDKVKGAINGIKDALQWISKHKDSLYNALKVIAAGFALLKLSSLAANITRIVSGLSGLRTPTTTTPTTQPTTTPTTTPTTQPTTQPTSGPATAPSVAPTDLPTGPSVYNPVTGTLLSSGGWGSAGGIGTGLAGGGSLSLGTMLGGAAGIALWAYGVSEIVNNANEKARKNREYETDYDRLNKNLEGITQLSQDYSFGGINKTSAAENYINQFNKNTGGAAQTNNYAVMRNLATTMGGDLLQLFDYTNTSGEQRNQLIDMLDMDDQRAMVAAMMLHAAGIDTGTVDYSEAYRKYQQLMSSGGTLGTEAYTTLSEYFNRSMEYSDGRYRLKGFDGSNEIMPVINGVPLANMSGYVMTPEASKPTTYTYTKPYTERYLTPGGHYETREKMGTFTGEIRGTWDPSARLMEDALSEMKVNTQSTKQAAEVAAGMDLKKFNGLPAEMRSAVLRGVASGVGGIRIDIDGQYAGRILAPIIGEYLGAEAQ